MSASPTTLLPVDVLSALACPRCSGALAAVANETAVRCQGCAVSYPYLDGIACLLPDPPLWQAGWRHRLHAYSAVLDSRLESLRAEADLPHLLESTRKRVRRVVDAVAHERSRLSAYASLLETGGTPVAAAAAMLPMALTEQETRAVLECDEHLFRDWVWGEEEIARLREFAEDLIPTGSARIGKLAVYGAGAGRLALEIHRALKPEHTFALDWNPLPLWVAARLLRGEGLKLYEMPLWPSRAEDVAVLRDLRYAGADSVPPGLTFLFADAVAPPFAPGSLDAVLTCWFIDAVPTDHLGFDALVTRIGRVLRPGGTWINVGPLRFNGPALSRNYTIEEVHELVERGGFALRARDCRDLPYFAAPLGGTRNLETMFGFAAERLKVDVIDTTDSDHRPDAIATRVPAWLTNTTLPVTITAGLVRLRQESIIAASIMSLVDGDRSVSDITRALATSWNLEPADVEPQVRAFFARATLD